MIDDSRGKSAYAVFAASVRIAGGRELQDHVEHGAVAEHLLAHLRRSPSTSSLGYGPRWWARIDTPMNSVPRIDAHPDQRGRGVLRLRAPERGHAVRDRLDTGERDRARREALQQDEEAERAARRGCSPASLNGDRIDAGGCHRARSCGTGRRSPARRGSRCRCRSGTAKIRPDSLMPRRFASVMNTMSDEARARRGASARPWNCGIETMAATPAEIDTATVRM